MPDNIKPVQLVLCWHMHQPEYRDLNSGQYQLPWTYLHALKDYTDMAAHLEMEPEARAVVNFAPVLLEQIEDYAAQIDGWLQQGEPIRDPLLGSLAAENMPQTSEERLWLAQSCLKANKTRMIEPWPVYKGLVDMLTRLQDQKQAIDYMSDQFLSDLLVWYHLSWMGETIRRGDMRIKHLLDKGTHFSFADRRLLIEVVGENLSRVLERYKILARQGRIELSMTPYGHPIMPLLVDLNSAREAWPEVVLPTASASYPDGKSRVTWHLEKGMSTFERIFEMRPAGCWPSEGSVSGPVLDLLGEQGFRWTASGETVLANSLKSSDTELADRKEWLYQHYGYGRTSIRCFFRDDKISDAIGFTYSTWHGDDAAANFVHELETLAELADENDAPITVSVILDGENAWEYYPANGYYFLSKLYRLLSSHPKIQMTTFSDVLDMPVTGTSNISVAEPENGPTRQNNNESKSSPMLKKLVSGSWVYGTFSTWIGDRDKNRGWDMLIEAKQRYDEVVNRKGLTDSEYALATHQLAICEGSDWCWWFGDYNPSGSVSDFDRLYRMHLVELYRHLGIEPPEYLGHAFTYGGGNPATGGTMRRGQEPT